ncbi:MAG: hypothetical protein R3Y04_09290 [Rikenellaceae bacterium]
MEESYQNEEEYINDALPNEELFHAHVIKGETDLLDIDNMLRSHFSED